MRLALPLLVLALLSNGPVGFAQDEAPPARVARLVKRLGSKSYSARTRATAELEKLGDSCQDQLEKALTSPDVEVRMRARELLEKIKSGGLWRPSLASFQCRKELASHVLKQLAEKTGNRLAIGDQYGTFRDGPVTLDLQHRPFWFIVDEVCRQTGNHVRPHYDQRKRGFVAISGPPGKYPLSYAGPVRAKITGARRVFIEELDYETLDSELTHNFNLNLQLTWEDRFQLVAYRSQIELVDAVTDTGRQVAATQSSAGEWHTATDSTRQVSMTLQLHPPPVSAKQLDVLRLKWGLIAVGELATLKLTDLSLGKIHRQHDVRLKILSMEKAEKDRRFKTALLLSRDLVAPEPRSVMFQENEFDLVDDKGRALRKMVHGWRMTDEGLRIQVTFTRDSTHGPPHTLRFTYPRLRSERGLEITFRDVPLPTGRPE